MAREREDGLAALQKGDLPTAAILLEQVVRQDKEDFESHLYLGGVYHQMKRHGDAARVLTRATELQPESAQARFNLGVAQEQGGDLTGAQASYQQAIMLQAEYPVAHEALERVEARLNGPVRDPEAISEAIPEPQIEAKAEPIFESRAEPTPGAPLDSVPAQDKPVFAPPVKSSFGSGSPASPPASPSTPDHTPASSATPVFPAETTGDSGRPAPYQTPTSNPPGYDPPRTAAPLYPASGIPGAPPPPTNPYAPGYGANPYASPPPPGYGPPPGYAPAYSPGYAQPPMPGQPQPYGQPPPQPGQPPYGQPPYGPGYAPPGVYGYGGAQQYMVKQQVPQEATIALILSILGLPVICTGLGIVFSPISLYLALKARRMMQADPSLSGQGTVTAALWLSWIGLGLNILVWIAFIIAMFTGSSVG